MIVGYEGLIGAFLMLGVLLPIVSVLPGRDGDGIHEDTADTWHVSSVFNFFFFFVFLSLSSLSSFRAVLFVGL